jgi:hypothetical protein
MDRYLDNDIEAWEGEGGATPAPLGGRAISMSGTANQVEWAVLGILDSSANSDNKRS